MLKLDPGQDFIIKELILITEDQNASYIFVLFTSNNNVKPVFVYEQMRR